MKPLAKKEGLVLQELPEEVVVYDTAKSRAFCLNQTSAFVWKNCDGKNTVSDISALLSKEFRAPVSDDLVWLALDQLGKDELLVESPRANNRFDGMTRRDVIRKVGLATAVALPMVAMLSFPSQVLAVTCAASGCGTASVDCAGLMCCQDAPGSGTYSCQPVGACPVPC